MKKKIVLLALLAGVIWAVAFPGRQWLQRRQEAARKEAERFITAYGNIDIRQVALAFRVGGRLERLAFEEGDSVEAGELVGRLDAEPFAEQVTLCEANLRAAQATLERLVAGSRPQEIAAARAAMSEAQATLTTLQAEYERLRDLIMIGAVARQDFDNVKANRDAALARLNSAREELSLREEGSRQEDIAAARAQVSAGEAQLEIARTALGDTRLYAPSSGTVLARVLEPGSIAAAGATVLTLSLHDPVWVRAYIPEAELGHVYPGMEAEIFTDSQPERPYRGQVGFVSPEAEFTPRQVETPELRTRLVYRLRVIVANPDNGLRQGMPVTVKFLRAARTPDRNEAIAPAPPAVNSAADETSANRTR